MKILINIVFLICFSFNVNANILDRIHLMHKTEEKKRTGNDTYLSLSTKNVKQKIDVITISDDVSNVDYVMSMSNTSSDPDFSGYLFGNKFPNQLNRNKTIWYPHGYHKSNNINAIFTPKAGDFLGMANRNGAIIPSVRKYHDVADSDHIYPVLSLSAFDKIKQLHLGDSYQLTENEVFSDEHNEKTAISALIRKAGNLSLTNSEKSCSIDEVKGQKGISCVWRSFDGELLTPSNVIKFVFIPNESNLSSNKHYLYKVSASDTWKSLNQPTSLKYFSGHGSIKVFIPVDNDTYVNEKNLKQTVSNFNAKIYSYKIKDKVFLNSNKKVVNDNKPLLTTHIFSFMDDATGYEYVNTLTSKKKAKSNQSISYIYGQQHSPVGDDAAPSWSVNIFDKHSQEPLRAYPEEYFSGLNDNGAYTITPIGWKNLINNDDTLLFLKNNRETILNRVKKSAQIIIEAPDSNRCHLGKVNRKKGYICLVRSVLGQGYYLGTDNLSIKTDESVKQYKVNDRWYDVEQSIPLMALNNTKNISIFIPKSTYSKNNLDTEIKKIAFYITEPGYFSSEESEPPFDVTQSHSSIRFEGEKYYVQAVMAGFTGEVDYGDIHTVNFYLEAADLTTSDDELRSYISDVDSMTLREIIYDSNGVCNASNVPSGDERESRTFTKDMSDLSIGLSDNVDFNQYCYALTVKLADDSVVNEEVRQLQFRSVIKDSDGHYVSSGVTPVRIIFDDEDTGIITQNKPLIEGEERRIFSIFNIVAGYDRAKSYTYELVMEVPENVTAEEFRDRFTIHSNDELKIQFELYGHLQAGGSWDADIVTVEVEYDDVTHEYVGSFDLPPRNEDEYYYEYGLSAQAYDNTIDDDDIDSEISLKLTSDDTSLDGKENLNRFTLIDNDSTAIAIDEVVVASSVNEGDILEYHLVLNQKILSVHDLGFEFSLDLVDATADDITDISSVPLYAKQNDGWSVIAYLDLNDPYVFAINNLGLESDEYRLDIPIADNAEGESDEILTINSQIVEVGEAIVEYDPTEYSSDVTILADLGFELSTYGSILFDYDIGHQSFNPSRAQFDVTFPETSPYLFEAKIDSNTLLKTDSSASMDVALALGNVELSDDWVELDEVISTGSGSYQFTATVDEFKK